MSEAKQLPPPRLVVTTHDEAGTSVFASDESVPQFFPFGPAMSGFSTFDTRTSVPVSNTSPALDQSKALPRCPPGGVLFCTTDMPPNYSVPMHRTISLDYAAIISGEIILKLDSGEEKTFKAGEFIVQKGTNHSWINRTNDVCRILFVGVSSEKIVLGNGQVLEETVIKRPGAGGS